MSSRQCVTPDLLCCSHPTALTLCEWEELGGSGRRGSAWEEGEVGAGGSGRSRKWEEEEVGGGEVGGGGSGRRRKWEEEKWEEGEVGGGRWKIVDYTPLYADNKN